MPLAATPTPSRTFAPTPGHPGESHVFDQLADPDLTLREVAAANNTSLESLVAWMTRPDIEARLSTIESAITRRTRFVAASHLPTLVQTLRRVLDESNADADAAATLQPSPSTPVEGVAESSRPGEGGPSLTLSFLEYRRRARESTRRAAALLLRLANFHGFTAPRLTTYSPAPSSSRSSSPWPAPEATAPFLRAPSLSDLHRSTIATHHPGVTASPPPATAPSPSSANPKPEGLSANSRGWSEPLGGAQKASGAPGKPVSFSPNPEGVPVTTARGNATHTPPLSTSRSRDSGPRTSGPSTPGLRTPASHLLSRAGAATATTALRHPDHPP